MVRLAYIISMMFIGWIVSAHVENHAYEPNTILLMGIGLGFVSVIGGYIAAHVEKEW